MLKCIIIYFVVDIFLTEEFINPFGRQRLNRTSFSRRTGNDPTQNWDLDPTFNASFFPALRQTLELKYMNQTDSEKYEVYSLKYPWLARVTFSEVDTGATICTAACIRPLVFMAAARCIIGLTVGLFGVWFENIFYVSKAIVFPDEKHHSKQYFDDFGFVVVVQNLESTSTWPTVKLFDETNRTDDTFQWFEKLGYEDKEIQHKLLAFNMDVDLEKDTNGEDILVTSKLYMQDVVVGIRFCQNIFTRKHTIKGFFVPCAFVCTEAEFHENNPINPKCSVQIMVTGAIILNTKTNKLLGVATWGTLDQNENYNDEGFKLPVGIAVANSENFYNDLECAEKISKTENKKNVTGYYQEVCNPNKKMLRKIEHRHNRSHHHHFCNKCKYSYSDSLDLSEY